MNGLCRRSLALQTFLAAACLLLTATLAHAQASASDDLERRLAQMEREIAAMQTPAQSAPASPDYYYSSTSSSGWIAGAELVYLQPMASNGNVPGKTTLFERDVINGSNIESELHSNPYGFEPSSRYWLGYVGESGAGIRARYWEFAHSVESTETYIDYFSSTIEIQPVTGNLECRTVDLEVTKQLEFDTWKLTPFAGCRYAGMSQTSVKVDSGGSIVTHGLNYYGAGLTGGVESYVSLLGFEDFGWATDLRGSLMFGSHNLYESHLLAFQPGRIDVLNIKTEGDLMGILEISTGPQWQTPLQSGGYFFCRGTGEGQLWLNSGTLNGVVGRTDSLGFVGFGFSLGVVR